MRHRIPHVLIEVELEPDEPPVVLGCWFGAPAVGERVDEVEAAAGRGGWPVERGALGTGAAVGHLDAQQTITTSESERNRVGGAEAGVADAISHQLRDQESDVECGLVVLVQWQSIHSLPSRAGRIGPRKLD